MSANDDETPQRFALGLVFFLVAAVVIFSIIFGIFHVRRSASAPTTEAVVATVVDANADVARIEVVDGVVKFYFATGKADIAAGANEALANVLKAVAEGKSAVISGFHDATGDAALNAELAKQRAMAVRDVLKAQGAAEDKLELQKPEQTQATGSNAEARRVEVSLR